MFDYECDFKYDTIEPKNKPAISMGLAVATTRQMRLAIAKQSSDYVTQFEALVEQWRKETLVMSTVKQMTSLNSFKSITAMKEKALPLIYRHLSDKPSMLVVAAIEISGENPTPPAAQGNLHKIVDAWLRWAERTGVATN